MVIYLINKDECFEKGLLQKEQPSLDLAKKSIKQANFFLSEAHDLFDIKKEMIAIISLYNAYFHTGYICLAAAEYVQPDCQVRLYAHRSLPETLCGYQVFTYRLYRSYTAACVLSFISSAGIEL